jgi:hypothetical protein
MTKPQGNQPVYHPMMELPRIRIHVVSHWNFSRSSAIRDMGPSANRELGAKRVTRDSSLAKLDKWGTYIICYNSAMLFISPKPSWSWYVSYFLVPKLWWIVVYQSVQWLGDHYSRGNEWLVGNENIVIKITNLIQFKLLFVWRTKNIGSKF